MAYDKGASKDDILAEAQECFKAAQSNESQNRAAALDDIKFARLGEQWPQAILTQREHEGRPAHTINKMPSYIRQVTNEARQNKPSIKVRPVDSGSDPKTAQVFTGLIRNIEQVSSADIAYDTASDAAVTGGFGYIKVDFDYAYDDAFEKDIKICPVYDPFSIYADPNSVGADSSDWMKAFELCPMTVDEFEAEYPKAEKVDWDSETAISESEEQITVAKYWVRSEYERTLLKLQSGVIIPEDELDKEITIQGMTTTHRAMLEINPVVGSRKTKSYKVKRCVLSGADVLDEEAWPGKYIPIIPVYGDVVNVEGTRYFQSLIRHAKDAQRQYNFQRSAETEMIALEPKAPWLVRKGSVDEDPNWATANKISHAFLEYTGEAVPQRTQLNMAAGAAAMQAARSANDDMKGIIGIYDASLGNRSNETSGKAIMARQREGDVSTYHFIDNLSRAIRHVGRVVMDLIPKVYTPGRVVRVLGEDGDVGQAELAEQPNPEAGIYNLGAGKYDLAVEAGPSYTTRRVEAAEQMTAMFQAMPDAAPLLGDIWAKMQDWPMADKIEQRLAEARQAQQGPSPEQQKMELEKQKLQMQAQHDQAKSQADLAMERERMALEQQKGAQEMQLKREMAEQDMEIERMKAGIQLELQSQKTQADIQTKQQVAEHGAALKEKGMEQKQQAAMSVNLGDNVGQTIAETMSAAMERAGDIMAEKLSNVTLKVQMPRMKRTAIRKRPGDDNSPIVGSFDEPVYDEEQGTIQ